MASTAGLPEPPDKATLERLVQTHTDDEIARMYGRTRTAIHYWRERFDLGPRRPTVRMSHKDYLPWTVRSEHARDYAARMLRLCSAFDQGAELTETELRQRQRFLDYLDEHQVVVDYDPDRGFGWRRKQTGETLIRRPEGLARRAG